MAWKVYGASAGNGYSRDAGGEVYGPLPLKLWIRVPGEKYRIRHKVTPAHVEPRDKDRDRKIDERRAKQYALWLAQRDGLAIPCGECRVEWAGIYSTTQTRKVRSWNGVRTQAAYLPRIRAVEWGRMQPCYNTRKDGRRGAWTHDEFVAYLRIEIPHWDFEPTEPVEETEFLQAAE